MTRAVVVFTDAAGLWWLRLLKPGFRHCFVVLETTAGWVAIEPMSHFTKVSVVARPGFDLAGWYRARGFRAVVTVVAEPTRRAAPWRPYSCVEAVKRVLGLRASWALTPWQLFVGLSVERKKNLDGAESLVYNPSHQHQNCVRIPPPRQGRRFFCTCEQNKTRS